ncbi:hypothetical protein AB8O38_08735 [Saccharomonospora xinjiangensis]|uniref:DUF3137 domain-containing protein n=1 Tax=Saccharomonospora xinjiangensis XJ-54 TaxID=882086 RepID=I0V174_9PSEU|nr:hypothetical protein [Saccharomonospora xinjiangensis]EID53877.1 hypothetical protein SacxiDRAFT_1630 [Saccharomonospora xinjiangensis XJ-54]
MEIWIDLSPLLGAMALGIGLLFWWQWHSARKEQREHVEALTALAARLGGTISHAENATAWSAELLRPFRNFTGGFINWLGTVRRPRFEIALDFERGAWRLRVTEASMERRGSNGAVTRHECRIEVTTAALPPVKLARRLYTDFLGRPLKPGDVLTEGTAVIKEPPVTVAERQGEWQRLWLPEPGNSQYAVFAHDPAAANRMFNREALEYLVENAGALPFVLTFEAGLLYATMPHRIIPEALPKMLDAVLGLLERIPGAEPVENVRR